MKENPVFLLGVSYIRALDASDTRRVGFSHTKQLCDTCLVPYNSTQFSADPVFLEGASIPQAKGSAPRDGPHATSDASAQVQVVTVPLTRQLGI